ncbi:expressed protein [Phakopsora pachyrhizi]|uniref:Expressed protein n=1 Tax=Phakopsora pachyrhizi TaxID=170000 RepID=A0AAV0ASW7_PHAPC|nr:expressed protein [Phakopsora pachyrhizi]
MIPPIFLNFITVSLICLKTSLASDPQNKYNITGNILYLNNTNKTQPEGDLYIWRNSIELGEKPLTVIGRDGNQRYNISDWFINGEKVERGYVIEDTMGNFVNGTENKKATCGFGHVYHDSAGNRFELKFKNIFKHHERWHLKIPQIPSRGNKTFSYDVKYNQTARITNFVDSNSGFIAANLSMINATNTPVSSLVGGDVALVLGHFESEVEPASFISYVTLLQKRKHRCHRVENNPFLISLGVTLQEPLAPIIVGAVQATS